MLQRQFHKTLVLGGFFGLLLSLGGCVDLRDPNYGSSYGGSSYDGYDGYRDHNRHDWDRDRRDRHDWDDHHRRDDDRRHWDEDRHEHGESRRPPPERRPTYQPPPPPREHCPSGFSPSEQKCSSEERKHGCKDIRLPGGLGCVRR